MSGARSRSRITLRRDNFGHHDFDLPAPLSNALRLKGGQRAAPVVMSEGPTAGGGVSSSTVDPGVPLGPELGGTW
jgi:hypothetical protein